jgi:hypothetical protein
MTIDTKNLIAKLRSAFIDIELSAVEANKIADALERKDAALHKAISGLRTPTNSTMVLAAIEAITKEIGT